MDFLDKTYKKRCKREKATIILTFYVFEIL